MKTLIKSRRMILEPVKDSCWASEMVLNPAIIEDKNYIRVAYCGRRIP